MPGPIIGTALRLVVHLDNLATSGAFLVDPPFSAGDAKISKDGGAFSNLGTLPAVVPAGGSAVQIDLSALEMTVTDIADVLLHDPDGAWGDIAIQIKPTVSSVDAIATAITALNNLSQANIRTAVGLASANMDTQLDALPTTGELTTALASADDAILAALTALNNLSSAQAQTAVAAALTAYTVSTAAQVSAASTLTTGERTAIAAALLDLVDGIEVGMSMRAALRLLTATHGGEISGMETATILIRNAVADSKVRLTVTADEVGNRSAVLTDLT